MTNTMTDKPQELTDEQVDTYLAWFKDTWEKYQAPFPKNGGHEGIYKANLVGAMGERVGVLLQYIDQLRAQLEAQLAAASGGWEPVNPISMANDEYADAEIKLCYRRNVDASAGESGDVD